MQNFIDYAMNAYKGALLILIKVTAHRNNTNKVYKFNICILHFCTDQSGVTSQSYTFIGIFLFIKLVRYNEGTRRNGAFIRSSRNADE